MKRILFVLSVLVAGTGITFAQQYGVGPAPSTPTTSSPGLVFAWPEWASQNFLYDGEYLNQYGIGFHGFDDGNGFGSLTAYVSSHFGVDLFTAGQRRLRVNYNGNVGIGGVPQTKLDLGHFQNGGTSNQVVLRLRNTIAQNLYSGWGSAIEFFNMSNNLETVTSMNEGGAKIISEASEYGWAHNLKFRVVRNNNFNSQTGFDALVINTIGNVGIGTPNPDAALAVKGTIHTQEVLVDMTVPGPDYVFEDNYNLLSLAELEAYIKANKHLPEVPSTREMEANGLHLKEMNLLLLKKVEELTLHLIEANKKIDETNLKVKALEAKMRNK